MRLVSYSKASGAGAKCSTSSQLLRIIRGCLSAGSYSETIFSPSLRFPRAIVRSQSYELDGSRARSTNGGHHVAIGRDACLSDVEIRRIIEGPDATGWDSFEATLLRAVDELDTNTVISDSTWGLLAERYNTEQLIDFVFTVGQYKLVSMALNSLGVQLEEGFEGFEQFE